MNQAFCILNNWSGSWMNIYIENTSRLKIKKLKNNLILRHLKLSFLHTQQYNIRMRVYADRFKRRIFEHFISAMRKLPRKTDAREAHSKMLQNSASPMRKSCTHINYANSRWVTRQMDHACSAEHFRFLDEVVRIDGRKKGFANFHGIVFALCVLHTTLLSIHGAASDTPPFLLVSKRSTFRRPSKLQRCSPQKGVAFALVFFRDGSSCTHKDQKKGATCRPCVSSGASLRLRADTKSLLWKYRVSVIQFFVGVFPHKIYIARIRTYTDAYAL